LNKVNGWKSGKEEAVVRTATDNQNSKKRSRISCSVFAVFGCGLGRSIHAAAVLIAFI